VFEPSIETQAEATAHVLGGVSASSSGDTPEARRARALQAALDRLSREDQEIEDMCGSVPKSQ
jgi:hypothetical protein